MTPSSVKRAKQPFIHPRALVETDHIGAETRVWAFVHILKGAVIGRNCNICDLCFIEGDVVLGDNVTVKSGVHLWNGLRVADNVFLGPNVTLTNDLWPRSKRYGSDLTTRIHEGASIGANATLLPGIEIGRHAFVGAGSVVTRSVPDYGLYFGNPAHPHGYVCRCAGRLSFRGPNGRCRECGEAYRRDKKGVVTLLA